MLLEFVCPDYLTNMNAEYERKLHEMHNRCRFWLARFSQLNRFLRFFSERKRDLGLSQLDAILARETYFPSHYSYEGELSF